MSDSQNKNTANSPASYNKKRILILQNTLLHYRKAFYNLLSERYEVTILHSGKESVIENEDKYREIIVKKKVFGPIILQLQVLKHVNSGEFDTVIAMCDLHWVNNIVALYFHPKNTKFIWWGSWFTNKYWVDKLKTYLAQRADSNIFYSEAAKADFKPHVTGSKLFVANNTFDVGKRVKAYEYADKKRILFVGSLDERKQNDVLIKSFYNIVVKINPSIQLTIIGEGAQRANLEALVNTLKLNNRVTFEGKINAPEILETYYAESIVSVSFGQAGLSVLQSLGYGVPFLTKKNAISGGEKTNIKDGLTGIFCDDNPVSLEKSLLTFCSDLTYARKLGENAYNYYSRFCTIENMAQGFSDAIENTRHSEVSSLTK